MIAIINYNAGNIASVVNALEFINQPYVITNDLDELKKADGMIFPGQGAAGAAMQSLKENNLVEFIQQASRPVLGICLGLQLLAEYTEEDTTEGLGLIKGEVKKFPPGLRTPQIGWNQVRVIGESKLMKNIPDQSYFYFAHSYYLPVISTTKAASSYGILFTSVIEKNNFYATQFHPEKSGELGLKILSNFCELC